MSMALLLLVVSPNSFMQTNDANSFFIPPTFLLLISVYLFPVFLRCKQEVLSLNECWKGSTMEREKGGAGKSGQHNHLLYNNHRESCGAWIGRYMRLKYDTYSRTSRLNCFLLFPRNSPIICRLRPLRCNRKCATPIGVSGMKPREIRNWIPLSGFLKKRREGRARNVFQNFIIPLFLH